MRISFLKILAIIAIAAAIGLLVNYLQPDGLDLFNENKYENTGVDQKIIPHPAEQNNTDYARNDTLQQDYNKIAVEKNRMEINEDLLPSYDYKTDTDLRRNPNRVPSGNSGNSGDVILSNLTTDVFNQPRLISLSQAHELYRNNVLFIDARNQDEYEEGHIAGAINIPYFSVEEFSYRLNAVDKSRPLVTYCEGSDCDMSIRLGNELFARGYKKVFVFFGGWKEWKYANYPVISSNGNFQLN